MIKNFTHGTLRRFATAVALAISPALAVISITSSPSYAAPATAHVARTVNVTDTGRLHYLHSSGSVLFEEGLVTGTLPGNMRAHCNIGAQVSATFTIYAHGGSITGHGTAAPHGSGTIESFAGTLTVTSGTGRYRHARGRAGLYGTFNRKTYALVVQTTGHFSY